MMKLHTIQAKFGDCFLLEYGDPGPSYILIDGGPAGNYNTNLKSALASLMNGNKDLDAVIISHVDNDHILGVLDLFVEIKYQKDTSKPVTVNIGELWFNSFSQTIDPGDFEQRLKAIDNIASVKGLKMQSMSMAFAGITEGYKVLSIANYLKIPQNPGPPSGYFLGSKTNNVFNKDNLKITVVGPTIKNLQQLQKEWDAWIQKNEKKIKDGQYTADFAAMSDKSVPNLSSIILLVEGDGRSILLTGDCRCDHLKQGLIETGLSADGKFHVDVFKVPHHGSDRNTDAAFFDDVTADTYIISADGRYDNPDADVLYWIVEAAKKRNQKIKIILTNITPASDALQNKYKPADMGYELQFLPAGQNWFTI